MKINLKSIKSGFKTRAFRIGSYSTFASVIVIAIAAAVVLIVEKVPTNYTKFDVTSNKLYSVSDQTKQIVSGLKKNVEIYLLAQKGKEDSTIKEMLNKYKTLSDNVKVVYEDPVVNPSFSKKYTNDTVSDNSIIVVSGNKSRYIDYNDIYVPDYSSYNTTGQTSTNFDGESSVTSAIDYVTSENLPKAYLLSGHGEQNLSSTVSSSVEKQNIETPKLNLLTADIPQDASCIIIYSPASDISEAEKGKLLDYLKKGGNLLLVTDYSDKEIKNLSSLMEYYGAKVEKGLVVEGDMSRCIKGYNYYLLPKIGGHSITLPISSNNYYILMPLAQGIKELNNKRSSLNITELLFTSEKAFSKPDGYNMTTAEKEPGDINGPFALGVAITEPVKGSQEETNIVWYTTSKMLDDKVNSMVSGANLDLFVNSLGWMCEHKNSISIHPKTLEAKVLTLPTADAARWSLLFVGVIPLIFLVAGIVVWVRRKRR